MSMLGGRRNVGGCPIPNVIFPSVLAHHIQGTHPQYMTLRDLSNKLWRMKIEKHGDDWYFTHGWRKFVRDNAFEKDEVLVFEYVSNGLFNFKILGWSSCEGGIEHLTIRKNSEEKDEKIKVKVEDAGVVDVKVEVADVEVVDVKVEDVNVKVEDVEVADVKVEDVEVECTDDETANGEAGNEDNEVEDVEVESTDDETANGEAGNEDNENEDDEFAGGEEVNDEEAAEDDEEVAAHESDNFTVVEEQIRDANGAPPVGGRRKRRKNIDFFGADIFLSGRMPQPTNPYFVTEVRDTRVNELYIPADIAKVCNLELPSKMMLVDPHGRMFASKRRQWKDGRTVFVGGWKSICRVNLARKDDKIICEFVHAPPNGDLQMIVTFFRP